MSNGLRVSEFYGPVFQGEGPAAGRRSVFLRLGLCNLTCSWCDTPYTWDWSRFDKEREAPERDLFWLTSRGAGWDDGSTLLVLTGGEPLMQQRNDALHGFLTGWTGPVHVETNGTLRPGLPGVDLWVVSPKVGQQDDPESKRVRPAVLEEFRQREAVLKLVAPPDDPGWWDRADSVAEGWEPSRVWVMPEGVTADRVLSGARELESGALERGWCLSLRTHVLMHGDKRGT